MYKINGVKVYTAADVPEPDTRYMLPWSLKMIYEIEPGLKEIAEIAVANKRCRYQAKRNAYVQAKDDAWALVGWYARDPRLRSQGAWDCYFDYILGELNI